jgi:hypothetical protein
LIIVTIIVIKDRRKITESSCKNKTNFNTNSNILRLGLATYLLEGRTNLLQNPDPTGDLLMQQLQI